jgi:hypothetical protein
MVRTLSSSLVDHGFEPRLGQAKDYKIGICCFSTKHAALRSNSTIIIYIVMVIFIAGENQNTLRKPQLPYDHDGPHRSV